MLLVIFNRLTEAFHRLQVELTLIHQEARLDVLLLVLAKRAILKVCLNLTRLLLVINRFDDLLPSTVRLDRLLLNCSYHVVKVVLHELQAFGLHEWKHHVNEHQMLIVNGLLLSEF